MFDDPTCESLAMVDVKTTCCYDSIDLDQFAHGMKMKIMVSFKKKKLPRPYIKGNVFLGAIFHTM
jgi:hypothetical protein